MEQEGLARLISSHRRIEWARGHTCEIPIEVTKALVQPNKSYLLFLIMFASKTVTKCNIFSTILIDFKKKKLLLLMTKLSVTIWSMMTHRLLFLQCQNSWKICHKCWQLVMVPQIRVLLLRHAWLNLWDKHMNNKSYLLFLIMFSSRKQWQNVTYFSTILDFKKSPYFWWLNCQWQFDANRLLFLQTAATVRQSKKCWSLSTTKTDNS